MEVAREAPSECPVVLVLVLVLVLALALVLPLLVLPLLLLPLHCLHCLHCRCTARAPGFSHAPPHPPTCSKAHLQKVSSRARPVVNSCLLPAAKAARQRAAGAQCGG